MVLYNISISDGQSEINGQPSLWDYTEEQPTGGNKRYRNPYCYIHNDAIRQRIRIMTKPNGAFMHWSSCDVADGPTQIAITRHNLGEGCLSRNYKNMSMSLVYHDVNAVYDEFNTIVYVTIDMSKYKLVKYTLVDREYSEILQTYSRRDTYQGCAIGFHPSKKLAENGILVLLLQNLYTSTYEKVTIKLDEETWETLTCESTSHLDKKELHDARQSADKYRNRYFNFKVTTQLDKFPTMVYITTEAFIDSLSAAKSVDNRDYRILCVDNPDSLKYLDDENFDPNHIEDPNISQVHEMFQTELVDARVRAVTLVNVDVPYKFCKQYNIVYLFKHILEEEKTFCLRSS